jgi:hypothetical protein
MTNHFNVFPPCWIRVVPVIERGVDAAGNTWEVAGRFGPRLPVVSVVESHADDAGLIAHELTHARQMWAVAFYVLLIAIVLCAAEPAGWVLFALACPLVALCAHGALYSVSRHYRLHAEVEAYAVQTLTPDGRGGFLSMDDAAARMCLPIYNLGLTVEAARFLIARRVGRLLAYQ